MDFLFSNTMNHADKEFLQENFFVIDSENLNHESQLYGYALFNNKLYISGSPEQIPANADGTYVNIIRTNTHIYIQQDYNGGYGLYLFQQEDFFAISNSFLYLINHLENKVKLSLNIDYSKYFITDELASLSLNETLINEVKLVSKNHLISIDIEKKLLLLIEHIDEPKKVNLNSQEGIDILDAWYYKWQNLLINLSKNGENIMVDLTGGMDSRATFSIFNSKELDFNKILVKSIKDELHTHKEDYEIASMIANRLGFKLNNKRSALSYKISSALSLNMSFFTKLGIHKQMYFKSNYNKERLFYFTGFGGESIRDHWNNKPEEFINHRINLDKFNTINCYTSIINIIKSGIDTIKNKYPTYDQATMMQCFYRNTRLRSHFGKSCVENLLTNAYCINPLMDRELQKITTNDDLLLCVIYERFLQNINDIKFDSNRRLDEEHIKLAKELNILYPRKINKTNSFSLIDQRKSNPSIETEPTNANARMKMNELFHSETIKKKIIEILGNDIYETAHTNIIRQGYFSDSLACALIAIVQANKKALIKATTSDMQINYSQLALRAMDLYKTARIDIKNQGMNNNLLFLSDISNYQISTPTWFQQENSKGYVIESSEMTLNIMIRCIGNGILRISLKGIDLKDKENKRIPVNIDYISCVINGIEHISAIKNAWHDKPLVITIPVIDNEQINLNITWRPHTDNQIEFIKLMTDILNNPPAYNGKYNN